MQISNGDEEHAEKGGCNQFTDATAISLYFTFVRGIESCYLDMRLRFNWSRYALHELIDTCKPIPTAPDSRCR